MFKKCRNCKKNLRSSNGSGYCWACFKKNTDGSKTKYNKNYRKNKGLIDESLFHECCGCNKKLNKGSKSGYCGNCFHNNVHNIKTIYGQKRWNCGLAKIFHWKSRGIDLTEEDIDRHNKINYCEICENILLKDKVMDHCHKTGKYRGTLCRQCNAAIGKLGDCLDVVTSRLLKYKNNIQFRSENNNIRIDASTTC
jgi:hypothetical protein